MKQKHIDNKKVTLTFGQLKRLIKEGATQSKTSRHSKRRMVRESDDDALTAASLLHQLITELSDDAAIKMPIVTSGGPDMFGGDKLMNICKIAYKGNRFVLLYNGDSEAMTLFDLISDLSYYIDNSSKFAHTKVYLFSFDDGEPYPVVDVITDNGKVMINTAGNLDD